MPVDTPIETLRIHRSSSNRCSIATMARRWHSHPSGSRRPAPETGVVAPSAHLTLAQGCASVPAMEPMSDPRLDVAVKAVPGWEGRHIGITPITTGITNQQLPDRGRRRGVRATPGRRDTELLGIDRAAEYEAGRAAAAAGVGPEIFAWLPHHELPSHPVRAGRTIPEAGPAARGDPRPRSWVRSGRSIRVRPSRSQFPVFRIVESYRRIARGSRRDDAGRLRRRARGRRSHRSIVRRGTR